MASDDAHNRMTAHTGSYLRFLSMFKVGTIITAIIAAAVVLIIAR